ncbi:MAG: hypothetical protein QM758_11855 [Armatimonas sp.]
MKLKKADRRIWIFMGCLLLVGGAVALLTRPQPQPPSQGVFYYTGPKQPKGGGPLTMEDGRVVSEAEAKKMNTSLQIPRAQ